MNAAAREPGDPGRSRKAGKRQPKYIQIANEVLAQVKDLHPGARCPGVGDISRRFGIGHATAEHVFNYLEARGFVRIVPGSGTYRAEPKSRRLAILSYHVETPGDPGGESHDNRRCKALAAMLAQYQQQAGHQVEVLPRVGPHGPDIAEVARFRPDLLITVYVGNNDYLEHLAAYGRPVISVMYPPLGLPMDFVLPSAVRSGYVAARSLFKAGLADVWYVGVTFGFFSALTTCMTQFTGFLCACQDNAMSEPVERMWLARSETDLARLIDQLFDRDPRPQAVVTGDNRIGQMVLAAAEERGMRVPRDLSVFAAGGDEPCSVSCLAWDTARIAAATSNLIHARLQRPDMPPQSMHIASKFLDHGTIPDAAARHVREMLPHSQP